MTATREQIAEAFFNLVRGAADFTASSRRFMHWDQVNETQMPFLTILKTGERRERPQTDSLATIVLEYHVFVYTSAGMDPEDVPDTQMNEILDAIDAAVQPTGADLATNRQTLGELVSHCFARGSVFVDAGDVDGKGVAGIPFEILVPWY